MHEPPRKLAIIGAGYVGLPPAMTAVEAGYDVVAIDLDRTRVERLRRGEPALGRERGEPVMTAVGVAAVGVAPGGVAPGRVAAGRVAPGGVAAVGVAAGGEA